jgi:hypothetical protein
VIVISHSNKNSEQHRAVGISTSLTNEEIATVISEIRQMWPECRMVRGSPRHSQSNGGVERVNRTVQAKLGAWMQDHESRRWSIGCRIVMWRYNTQQHRTGGDIPYRLLSGQVPRVGISSLLLDNALIDTLATEAQLNRVAEYDGMVDVVDSDQEVEAQEEEDNDNNNEGFSNNDGADDEEDSNNVPMADVGEEQVTQILR